MTGRWMACLPFGVSRKPHVQKPQTLKNQYFKLIRHVYHFLWKMRDQNLGLVPVTCCLPKHDCHTTSSVIHFTILKNNFWLLLPMFSTQFPPIAIYLVKLQKSSRKERVFFGKVGTEAECDAVTQSFDCASWRLKDSGRVETNRFYFVSVFD